MGTTTPARPPRLDRSTSSGVTPAPLEQRPSARSTRKAKVRASSGEPPPQAHERRENGPLLPTPAPPPSPVRPNPQLPIVVHTLTLLQAVPTPLLWGNPVLVCHDNAVATLLHTCPCLYAACRLLEVPVIRELHRPRQGCVKVLTHVRVVGGVELRYRAVPPQNAIVEKHHPADRAADGRKLGKRRGRREGGAHQRNRARQTRIQSKYNSERSSRQGTDVSIRQVNRRHSDVRLGTSNRPDSRRLHTDPQAPTASYNPPLPRQTQRAHRTAPRT